MNNGLLSIGDSLLVIPVGSEIKMACILTDVTFDPTSPHLPIQVSLFYGNGEEEQHWIKLNNIIGQHDGSVYIDLNI